MLQGMHNTADLDGSGGRFAILRTESEPTSELENSKSSKRRRRKSAKANLESPDSSEEPSALAHGSSGSSTSFAKPPLKSISEAAVLRSNSAEPASVLEATSLQSSLRQDRHTAEYVLKRTARRPHMSLSFQESRPATEGLMLVIAEATLAANLVFQDSLTAYLQTVLPHLYVFLLKTQHFQPRSLVKPLPCLGQVS